MASNPEKDPLEGAPAIDELGSAADIAGNIFSLKFSKPDPETIRRISHRSFDELRPNENPLDLFDH